MSLWWIRLCRVEVYPGPPLLICCWFVPWLEHLRHLNKPFLPRTIARGDNVSLSFLSSILKAIFVCSSHAVGQSLHGMQVVLGRQTVKTIMMLESGSQSGCCGQCRHIQIAWLLICSQITCFLTDQCRFKHLLTNTLVSRQQSILKQISAEVKRLICY